VNQSYDTLVKYLDPDARSRLAELQPFVRTRNLDAPGGGFIQESSKDWIGSS
jgi:hypothetical protein